MCEARVDEVQCDLDVAVGSKAGSVGRQQDVLSEVESIRAQPRVDPAEPLIRLCTDVAPRQPNATLEHSQSNFEGVFAPARREGLTPHTIDFDVSPRPKAWAPTSHDGVQHFGASPSDDGMHHEGASPSHDGMHSQTFIVNNNNNNLIVGDG